MGWFSNLYERAKSGISNAIDAVKHTYDNWKTGFYSPPTFSQKYRYCGAGNPINNGEPVNASDSACRQHDIDYENFKKAGVQGKELNDLVRESDDRLIANLKKAPDRDVGSYFSEYGIRAKKQLEDWGLLNPNQFVV
jgi:hypothetical protein